VTRTEGFARASTWLLPALVLAAAGAAKLAAPGGAPPRDLGALPFGLAWDSAMRVVGLVEVAVALGLCLPRIRRPSRWAAAALLVAFSLFVALHADDGRFVANCGCFGALRAPATGSPANDFALAVLRNALLVGLLVLGAALDRATWTGWPRAVGDAAFAAALALLLPLHVGTRAMLADERERSEAATFGRANAQREGGRLNPEIELLALDGRATSAGAEFRAGDHLLFFSPHCPVCRTSSAWWPQWAGRIAARGGRLLPVSLEDEGDLAAFVRECGIEPLAPLVFRRRLDATAIGIESVPALMVLGDGLEVVFLDSQCRGPFLAESLTLADARAPGTSDAVFRRIVEAAFGDGAVPGDAHAFPTGVSVRSVRRGDATVGRVFLARAGGAPAELVEAAVALDADGRVTLIVPVVVGGGLAAVDPGLSIVDGLRGVPLTGAIATAESRAAERIPEARAWLVLETLLRAVDAAGRTR
jgi:hypothetical protein